MKLSPPLLAILLLAGLEISAHAYNLYECTHWSFNPSVYTNTSTPTEYQPEVIKAIKAWNLAGTVRTISHAGTTGRDFASGCFDDEYFCDDDDGYNVIDWWTRHTGGYLGITRVIDVQNFDGCYVAEVDVEINPSKPFAVSPNSSQYSYRSVLTHEMGHFLRIAHSSESDALSSTDPLRWATMYWRGNLGSSGERYNTLNVDDINGIRALYSAKGPLNAVAPTGVTFSVSPASGGGVSFVLNPNHQSTNPESWSTPAGVDIYPYGYIDNDTRISWKEYDKNHSMVVHLWITGYDGGTIYHLYYARNASNWWGTTGYVCMNGCRPPNNPSSYNTEVSISRNLMLDFRDKYPSAPNIPYQVARVHIEHFVNLSWSGDNGGYVKDFFVGSNAL